MRHTKSKKPEKLRTVCSDFSNTVLSPQCDCLLSRFIGHRYNAFPAKCGLLSFWVEASCVEVLLIVRHIRVLRVHGKLTFLELPFALYRFC
jgi:hypothetical protein